MDSQQEWISFRTGLVGYLVVPLFLTLTLANVMAHSFHPDAIVGVWWSPEKDARVELYRSGHKLMGKIVWVEPDKRDMLDTKNPDKALRNKSIVGCIIFSDFIFSDGRWIDGKVYDPGSGKIYSCYLELIDSNTLCVHGYIGIPILGRSEKFTRFIKGQQASDQ